jgi:hypothetical protein
MDSPRAEEYVESVNGTEDLPMLSVQPRGAMLAVAVLLAGCASAPQNVAQTKQGSFAAPEGAPAASGAGASPSAVASIAPVGAADSAPESLVVDLNKRPADEAENTGQVCRQMLKPDTNSIITVCGTPAQWKKFRTAEAAQAEENLLRWQAGRF